MGLYTNVKISKDEFKLFIKETYGASSIREAAGLFQVSEWYLGEMMRKGHMTAKFLGKLSEITSIDISDMSFVDDPSAEYVGMILPRHYKAIGDCIEVVRECQSKGFDEAKILETVINTFKNDLKRPDAVFTPIPKDAPPVRIVPNEEPALDKTAAILVKRESAAAKKFSDAVSEYMIRASYSPDKFKDTRRLSSSKLSKLHTIWATVRGLCRASDIKTPNRPFLDSIGFFVLHMTDMDVTTWTDNAEQYSKLLEKENFYDFEEDDRIEYID